MHTKKLYIGVALLLTLTLSLLLTACSTSQVVTNLDTITKLVEAAAPVVLAAVSSNTLNDAQRSAITSYLSAVSSALQSTTKELQSGDTAAVQASKISGYFAAAALPNLTGAPAAVASVVSAVSVIVASYLEQYAVPKVGAVRLVETIVPQWSRGERRALARIHDRAGTVRSRLAEAR